jgi:hypothetical protein
VVRPRGERGSAVVDFVLVLVVLVPLFLGIVQVALVLHVRNTLTAAASEGARYGATVNRPPDPPPWWVRVFVTTLRSTDMQARHRIPNRFGKAKFAVPCVPGALSCHSVVHSREVGGSAGRWMRRGCWERTTRRGDHGGP